ncbi:hypothetical protein GCM10020000_53070 [Streptomyces olivoverticillatus]
MEMGSSVPVAAPSRAVQVDDGQRVEAEPQEGLVGIEPAGGLPAGLAQCRFRLPQDHREEAAEPVGFGQLGQFRREGGHGGGGLGHITELQW